MADLISRQAALDAVNGTGLDDDSNDTAQRVIETLPSAEPKQRWIPCSERLPEKEGEYLCTVRGVLCFQYCVIAKFCRDICEEGNFSMHKPGFVDYVNEYGAIEVRALAWMRLPEPYKEEP